MRLLLVFLVLVFAFCEAYTAKDAIMAMNKAIDAQNDETAKKYVEDVLIPKIKNAAEGGRDKVRYPSSWNECSSRPLGLDWGSVASILKKNGFETEIGEKIAYGLLSDPPPRFTTLDIFWGKSKSKCDSNVVSLRDHMANIINMANQKNS